MVGPELEQGGRGQFCIVGNDTTPPCGEVGVDSMNFVKLPACFVCMILANLQAGHPVNIFCERAQIPRVRAGQTRTISRLFENDASSQFISPSII